MESTFNKLNISNTRDKDESYEDYKYRLKMVNKIIKKQ